MKLIRSFKFMFVMGIMLILILLLPVANAASAMLNDKWSRKEATVEQNEDAEKKMMTNIFD